MQRFFVLPALLLILNAGSCSSDAEGNGGADLKEIVPGEVVWPDSWVSPQDVSGDKKVKEISNDEDVMPVDLGPTDCDEGKRVCSTPMEVSECIAAKWTVVTICPPTHFCSAGTCVKKEPCTPGSVNGCYSMTAINKCNSDGTAYIPVNCAEGEKCADGVCGTFICMPGQAVCLDNKTTQSCLDNGSGWGPGEPCPEGLTCVGGKCLSQCLSDPKWNNSYIGCEYWSVDLDNYHDPFSPTKPDEAIHGLILGNPGTAEATVTFSSFATDVAFSVPDVKIAAGQVAVVPLPRMDIDGSVINSRSVRVNSNRPIVAYQFNPLDFKAAYSDDSSLLIPAEVLGNEYFILTMPTSPLEAMPIMPAASQHGYFTVIAVEMGATNVSVRVTATADKPNAEGEFLAPGPYHNFTLQQGQVLNIQADGSKFSFKTDLSGSHVTADRKIAVFAGHEEAVIAGPGPDGVAKDCCCAEHLEEQLFPVDTWADHYLCAKARQRGPSDLDLWRVQAGQAGITITTNPPIDGIDGATLQQKGDYVEAFAPGSFLVMATGPIQVGQYLSSQTCTDDFTGDPALIMAVSETQYRTPYAFAVPKDYNEDYITVVKPAGATITLDGNVLGAGDFAPVADGTYAVGYFEVQDGPHFIEGDLPFGLYQYGFDGPASYGNPGGLNLIKTQQ